MVIAFGTPNECLSCPSPPLMASKPVRYPRCSVFPANISQGPASIGLGAVVMSMGYVNDVAALQSSLSCISLRNGPV